MFKLVYRLLGDYELKNAPHEQKIGLSENSFIGSILWVPHYKSSEFYKEDHSKERDKYFCKDFSNKTRPQRVGNLYGLITPDMINNPEDVFTPFYKINSLDDASKISKVDTCYLLTKQMIRYTTYEEAYRNVGLFDKYSDNLKREKILDELILTVTPKGNGRIFCFNESSYDKKGDDEDYTNIRPKFS